jgi:hypothetical protein
MGGLWVITFFIFTIVWILIIAITILGFYRIIRTGLPPDVQKKKTYKQSRNGLIWTGTIITWICNVMVQRSNSDIIIFIAATIGLIGLALALYGCYYWAKYKSRRGWWALFGLLTVLGYIVLAALRDRNTDLNIEEERKFGIYNT